MKYLSSMCAVSLLALSGCGGNDVETPKSGLLFQYNGENVKTGDEKSSPTASQFIPYQFLEAVLTTSDSGEQTISTPSTSKSFPLRTLISKFRIEYFNGSALDDLIIGYTGVGYNISISNSTGYQWNSNENLEETIKFINSDLKDYYDIDCDTATETMFTIDGSTKFCSEVVDFVNATQGTIPGGGSSKQVFSSAIISPDWRSITTPQFIAHNKYLSFHSFCRSRLALLDNRLKTTDSAETSEEITEALKWLAVDCGDRLRDLLAADPVEGFRLPPNMAALSAEWLARVETLVADLTANQNETIEQSFEIAKLSVDVANDQQLRTVYSHQLFNRGTYNALASFNFDDPIEPALSNIDFQIILEDTSINATLEAFTTRCSQQLTDLKTQLESDGSSDSITSAIKDVRIDCNEQIPLHLDYGGIPAGLLTLNSEWEADLEALIAEFEANNAETAEQLARLDAFVANLATDEATLEQLIEAAN